MTSSPSASFDPKQPGRLIPRLALQNGADLRPGGWQPRLLVVLAGAPDTITAHTLDELLAFAQKWRIDRWVVGDDTLPADRHIATAATTNIVRRRLALCPVDEWLITCDPYGEISTSLALMELDDEATVRDVTSDLRHLATTNHACAQIDVAWEP